MRKKILMAILLVFCVMLPFGLSACGKNDDNKSQNSATYCTVTFDSDGGSAVAEQKVEKGNNAQEPTAPTKNGYEFNGWYYGEEKWSFTENSVNQNITLKAKWTLTEYTITYNLNGGTNDDNNPETYTVETETITLGNPTKEHCDFDGWYSENTFENQVTQIVKGTTGNITLYAKWTEKQTYVLKDDGTIDFGSYPQTKVTDSSLISSLTDLAGTKPSSSNSAGWTSYKYYIGNGNDNSGTNATDYMWYKDISYGNDKYRAIYFTSYRPYGTSYSSSTNKTYQDDNSYNISTLYFFKYEPINWRILTQSNGKALLMCNMIIDSQEYYDNFNNRTINGETVYANNYAESNIRKWLNNTFYNTAFSLLEKQIIEFTTVDNSARSTNPNSNATQWNSGNNSYACENTNDYVFLLSEQEVTNSAYGFNSSCSAYDTARRMKSSDYAKSQGCYSSTSSSYLGNGDWWLRSPSYYSSGYSWSVHSNCYSDFSDIVDYTYRGVVPALWITL